MTRGRRSERTTRDIGSGNDDCSDDSNGDSNGDADSGDGNKTATVVAATATAAERTTIN
jgi:hypothetical protein